MPAAERESVAPDQVPVVVFLSGRRRRQTEMLDQKTLRIVRSADADVRFLLPDDENAQEFHATLHRAGDTYEIVVTPERNVWVNGERVDESRVLQSGDLLEIGQAGPVVRYRLYPPGATPRKSVADAVADSFDGARADGRSRLGKATRFVANITRDLATQTSLWFRIWVLVLLTALVVSVVFLVAQNLRLQKHVALEGVRIEGIAEMLERTGAQTMTREELLVLQAEVETRLAATIERLEMLEARSEVAAQVIAAASPSVALIQGAFGFIEPETARSLRYVESPEGLVLFTLEETEKVVELTFTGTAFFVSAEGLLLTNRHVAQPWLGDPRTEIAKERGLTPVIQRLLAFVPGRKDPIGVELVRASDEADLAVLKATAKLGEFAALELNPEAPRPGEEILVLGYPTGVQGLVARTSPEFLKAITPDGNVSFWSVVQHLSEAGYIKPLASRGIVSQVSEEVVAYDAETALGGSGGPVMDLSGRVVAINAAILTEFGGSNLGVPAPRALKFISELPLTESK
ncbi:MAG: trypsin-like peptidase domain-containing protein [Gammaproteobacteria bacterium]